MYKNITHLKFYVCFDGYDSVEWCVVWSFLAPQLILRLVLVAGAYNVQNGRQ